MSAMAKETLQLGRALLDGINARDLGAWSAALAPDATFSYPGLRDGADRATAIGFNTVFLDAFSDLHFEVTRMVAQGDTVVCCWVGRGTHDGPLALPSGTVPATGRKGDIPGVSVVTVRDGMIAREETYWNQVELLAQLGLL